MLLATASTGLGQPTIQFSASTYTVAEWAGTVILTVQRTADTNAEASAAFATADGTATNGIKYISTNGVLVFAAGVTNHTIIVPILNEGFVEGTRTLTVSLSNPTNAVLGARATATVNIIDTDVGIQFQFASYDAASHCPVGEDEGAVLIGVVRGDDATIPAAVTMTTTDFTASNGVDYIGFITNLSFAPAERLQFVPVTILNNALKQSDRTFRATLSNPVGVSLGTTRTTRVTIIDNDQGFQFSAATNSVAEDAGVSLITVLRGTDNTNSEVAVVLATSDGTAKTGADYEGVTTNISFAAGETGKVVPIRILNDGVREVAETFKVTLSGPTGGAVLGSLTNSTVVILDNDPGVGFEQAATTNAWGQAQNFTLVVLRGNDGVLGPFTVGYATSDLTARAGVDYTGVTNTLVFEENETIKCLPIPILRDRSGKSFRVTLSNPTGGAMLGRATTTVTIEGAYAAVAPAFDVALTIRRGWGLNVLSWTGGGQLQRADTPSGPWQTLTTATSPCMVQSPVGTACYRVTRPRPVNLYVPSRYTGQMNVPLLIMLHGYHADASAYEGSVGITRWAESKGFLYCYPEGLRDPAGVQFWNGTDSQLDFWNSGADDAGYLCGLIEEIASRFSVDRKRIYLFGIYGGGALAYRMACQYAECIAGIASWAGTTFLDPGRCQPSEPVNVLNIHGTKDEFLSYDGGTLNISMFGIPANMPPFPGAVQNLQLWAAYNGASSPITDPAPSLDLVYDIPGSDTVVTRYTQYPPGGAVELWSMIGATHVPNLSYDFSLRVIDWLLAHPKP